MVLALSGLCGLRSCASLIVGQGNYQLEDCEMGMFSGHHVVGFLASGVKNDIA